MSGLPSRKLTRRNLRVGTDVRYYDRADDFNALLDHSSGWVNVKSYGATGDGVTDDTLAVQAAIDAAGTNVILFPPGTYKISSSLNVSAAGAAFVAQNTPRSGTVSMLLATSTAVTPLVAVAQSAYDFSARGMVFAGPTIQGGSQILVQLATVNATDSDRDARFQDCVFSNANTAVKVWGRGLYVENSQITGLVDAFNFDWPTGAALASLTSVGTTATAATSAAHGLSTGYSVDISGATQTAYNGTYTITVTDPTHFTYTFAGAASPATGTPKYFAYANPNTFPEIQPTTGRRSTTIRNNRFHASNGYAVRNTSASSKENFTGLEFVGNYSDCQIGMFVGSARNSLWSGNNFIHQSGPEFNIVLNFTDGEGITITGNTIAGMVDPLGLGNAVRHTYDIENVVVASGTVQGITITGNVMSYLYKNPILFSGTVSNATVTGNVFNDALRFNNQASPAPGVDAAILKISGTGTVTGLVFAHNTIRVLGDWAGASGNGSVNKYLVSNSGTVTNWSVQNNIWDSALLAHYAMHNLDTTRSETAADRVITGAGAIGIGVTPTAKLDVRTASSGIRPTTTAATTGIVGEVKPTLGSGTGKGYGVMGLARAGADAAGDRVYGGWFKATTDNSTASEVGVHAEVVDASASACIWEAYAGGVEKAKLQGDGTLKLTVDTINVATGGSIVISTGVGSLKMSTANAATNAAWIPIRYNGTVYYVPGFTTNAP